MLSPDRPFEVICERNSVKGTDDVFPKRDKLARDKLGARW